MLKNKRMHWKIIAVTAAFFCVLFAAIFLWLSAGKEQSIEQTESEPATSIVSGLVTDSEGYPVTASLEILDLSTQEKKRVQTNLLGKYEVSLPIGTYEFTFSKGFEFERKTITVEVENRLRVSAEPIILAKEVDWNEFGWFCGDLHQHTAYSDGYQDVNEIFISDLANGLNWGLLTDHNSVDGIAEWYRGGTLFSEEANEQFVTIPGLEITTEMGHYNSLGSEALIDHSVDRDAKDIERIADEIMKSGGIAQVNHPYLTDGMGFEHWELIRRFDTIEIWNGKGVTNEDSNLLAKQKWFELLNDGIFLAATGGSDNHDITGNYPWRRENETDACRLWIERGLYSGMPRNYVYCPEGVSEESVLQGIKEGHNFITNGPLVLWKMDDAIIGDHISKAGDAELFIRLYDQRGLESAVLIEDGEVIRQFDVTGKTDFTSSETIPVKNGSWYVLEITGSDGGYAITNPIFVD